MELAITSSAHVQSAQSNRGHAMTLTPDARLLDQDQGEKRQTKEELKTAVEQINQLIQPHHTALHFILHDKLNQYYVQVIDTDNNQVLREIPPKKFLDRYASTLQLFGFLVDKKI
ncbi:flagellar protein FlaG [Pullulanibacillus pueri]|uniref:Flagellar protein FlaG n=1 Tax=Pullulanibacillus pueri TaxID=1437324 RepID=A0A8J3A0G8_9BACL|nr:flagellar protein FlaG [Pullulanibacillus pueri]MBM7684162.1 flagellar protein FlaG [Pullulanibacillus pueri]GGH88857.1 hypothetical protein GCM10007096_42140 [Pullulanibacillus pueri]